MWVAACGARREGPVGDREDILDLSIWLRVAGVEARQEAVGLRGERVDRQSPAAGGREFERAGPDSRAADRPSNLESTSPRVVVDALGDKDTAGRVQVQGDAPQATLDAAGSHGALLQKRGRDISKLPHA